LNEVETVFLGQAWFKVRCTFWKSALTYIEVRRALNIKLHSSWWIRYSEWHELSSWGVCVFTPGISRRWVHLPEQALAIFFCSHGANPFSVTTQLSNLPGQSNKSNLSFAQIAAFKKW